MRLKRVCVCARTRVGLKGERVDGERVDRERVDGERVGERE